MTYYINERTGEKTYNTQTAWNWRKAGDKVTMWTLCYPTFMWTHSPLV